MRSRVGVVLCVTLVATVIASAQSDVAVMAPTGTLRAVFLGLNPVHGHVDASGKAIGPVPDIVEALAKHLRVPFAIASAPNAAGIVSALDNGSADIGVVAYDAARARDLDFGAPLLVMLNSYLVRRGSTITRSQDVDRAGVTVAAVRGQTQELFVSSHLGRATVRVFETMPPQDEVERLLTGGSVDAFAINRQRSLDAERESKGTLRALPDSFLAVDQSFVVRKGDRAKLPILERFAATARSSGLIRESIVRAGLVGVDVAPSRK